MLDWEALCKAQEKELEHKREEINKLNQEIELLKIKSKAGYDFISKQIQAFESEPLDENGKHNLYVSKEFLERAKKALLDLGWIE
jgi:uncharacterized membrane protein YheB (UPF0754 family)